MATDSTNEPPRSGCGCSVPDASLSRLAGFAPSPPQPAAGRRLGPAQSDSFGSPSSVPTRPAPGVIGSGPWLPSDFAARPSAPPPPPPDSSVPLPDRPGDAHGDAVDDPCLEPSPTGSSGDPCCCEVPPSSVPLPPAPGGSSSAGVLSVISRRAFDFTNLAASGTLEVVMVRAANVVAWADATLLVRVHGLTVPSGAKLELVAKAIAPSPDAPAIDFLAVDPVATVLLDSTVSAPALRSAALSAGFGSHVQLVLRATQATSPATFTAEISADLVLRERAAEPTITRVYTNHSYDDTSGAKRYIPFSGTTAGTTLSATTNELRMLVPSDGWLQAVTVFGTVGVGDGVVGFHRNGNNTPAVARTVSVSSSVAARFDFGTDAGFSRGDRVSISYDPPGTASSPGDANVICEWVLRRSG